MQTQVNVSYLLLGLPLGSILGIIGYAKIDLSAGSFGVFIVDVFDDDDDDDDERTHTVNAAESLPLLLISVTNFVRR